MRTLLVLGNKLINNQCSDELIGRLETCIASYSLGDRVVVSGGIVKPNVVSEASVMRDYLVKSGINTESIVVEDKSIDTIENFINSREYLSDEVIVITSDYHVGRVNCLCNLLGLNVQIIGVKTKFKFRYLVFNLVGYYRIHKWRKHESVA